MTSKVYRPEMSLYRDGQVDPLAKFQWSARAPLINTSTHVLQIQLCHLQFPNCPRQTRPSHCWSRARPDPRDAESFTIFFSDFFLQRKSLQSVEVCFIFS